MKSKFWTAIAISLALVISLFSMSKQTVAQEGPPPEDIVESVTISAEDVQALMESAQFADFGLHRFEREQDLELAVPLTISTWVSAVVDLPEAVELTPISLTEPVELDTYLNLVAYGWGDPVYTFPGDYDGDGKADIAAAIGSQIYVYLNRGDKFRTEVWRIPGNEWGGGGIAATHQGYTFAEDFNGDGRTDIATAIGGTVIVHLSTGHSFNTSRWSVPNEWGGSGYTFAADFTGDGRADIASAIGGVRGRIILHKSTGSSFQTITTNISSHWGEWQYTRIGDFNGDGKTDIASADGYYGNVYMFFSDGNGFVREAWAGGTDWGHSTYTFIGDFSGDGRDDIATAIGGNVVMRFSDGNRFYIQNWVVPDVWGSGVSTWAADFDDDGIADIASAAQDRVFMHISNPTRSGFVNSTWLTTYSWGSPGYTWTGEFDTIGGFDIASAYGPVVVMRFSRGDSFETENWRVDQ